MLDISAWFNDLLADNLIFTPTTLGYYWEGLVTTTQLVFLSLVAGLILAVPLAIMRSSKHKWISLPVYLYTYVFRGTPRLIQLCIIYYGVEFIDGDITALLGSADHLLHSVVVQIKQWTVGT